MTPGLRSPSRVAAALGIAYVVWVPIVAASVWFTPAGSTAAPNIPLELDCSTKPPRVRSGYTFGIEASAVLDRRSLGDELTEACALSAATNVPPAFAAEHLYELREARTSPTFSAETFQAQATADDAERSARFRREESERKASERQRNAAFALVLPLIGGAILVSASWLAGPGHATRARITASWREVLLVAGAALLAYGWSADRYEDATRLAITAGVAAVVIGLLALRTARS